MPEFSPVRREIEEIQCEEIPNLRELKEYVSSRLDLVHQRKHLRLMCLLAEQLRGVPEKLTFETITKGGKASRMEVVAYLTLKREKSAIVYFVMKGKSARLGQLIIGSREVIKSLERQGLKKSEATKRFMEMKKVLSAYKAIRQSAAEKGNLKGISLDLDSRVRDYLCRRLFEELANTLTL